MIKGPDDIIIILVDDKRTRWHYNYIGDELSSKQLVNFPMNKG